MSAPNLKPRVELTIPAGFRHRRSLTLAVEATWQNLPIRLRSPLLKKYSEVSVSVTLISPRKMRTLNRQTRGKDRPTDVLAYSQLEGALPPLGLLHLGDIVICTAVAKEQASLYGASLKEELQRLTVHGFLHLLGYDHEKSPSEARRMFRIQNQTLRKL